MGRPADGLLFSSVFCGCIPAILLAPRLSVCFGPRLLSLSEAVLGKLFRNECIFRSVCFCIGIFRSVLFYIGFVREEDVE